MCIHSHHIYIYAQSPGVHQQHCVKLGVVVHACHPSTKEVQAKGSEFRGILSDSLGYVKPVSRKLDGGWVDGWMDEWMDGWVDGWMNGWTDGRIDGWTDGWMDRQLAHSIDTVSKRRHTPNSDTAEEYALQSHSNLSVRDERKFIPPLFGHPLYRLCFTPVIVTEWPENLFAVFRDPPS